MNVLALRNGRPDNGELLSNRGLAYGDGLFETLKVDAGRIQFLELHLARLLRDCARLDIALDEIALRREIDTILRDQHSGILKMIVTRQPGARGYAAARGSAGERHLLFHPQAFAVDSRSDAGVEVRLCRQTLAEQPALAGMKHLNRLEQVIARSEWSDPRIAEGLMLDQRGRVVEGTMSNVFIVSGGTLLTPSLHRCGVAGIIRQLVIERLAPPDVPLLETDLLPADLLAADEVFLCNSVIGIWPVRKIECLHKPVGDVTIALQNRLYKLIADGLV